MADVRSEAVTRRFGNTTAVSDMSLDIWDGEFVVLLGPTGAGKTTTLRLVAGLERPDAGRIVIGGRDVTTASPAERDVALVFQQYSLYPHLSVYDNLAFPLRAPIRRISPDAIDRKVREVAKLLQIDSKLQNRATQLSGGQMQRVAIGRALVRSPSIYLMDEPLSSLDAKLRAELRIELKRIQQDLGATVLYVTHDQTEALTLADRVGVMEHGRLVQIGSPRDIYETPVNIFAPPRLGSPAINLVPRSLLPDLPAPPAVATVGVRTEHVQLSRSPAGAAVVTRVEHLGDQDHLHVRLADRELITLSDPDVGLEAGDRVTMQFVGPILFDAAGARVRP